LIHFDGIEKVKNWHKDRLLAPPSKGIGA